MAIGGPNIYPPFGGFSSVSHGGLIVYAKGTAISVLGSRGIPGFDDKAERETGTLTGIRWWTLQTTGLTGAWATWKPGDNKASCMTNLDHQLPAPDCGCGFWAYWQDPLYYATYMWHGPAFSEKRYAYQDEYTVPVVGTIEGWGRSLAGSRGFRCEYAKITALLVPPAYHGHAAIIQPQAMIYTSMKAMLGEHPPGWGKMSPGLPD